MARAPTRASHAARATGSATCSSLQGADDELRRDCCRRTALHLIGRARRHGADRTARGNSRSRRAVGAAATADLGPIPIAIARPAGKGPFPTVIILHGSHGFAREY